MKRNLLTFSLVLTLAVFVLPVAAQAGDIYHYSGRSAFAYFYAPDPSNPDCAFVQAAVQGGQNRQQSPPGPGSSGTGASVSIWRYDYCNDISLLDASGWSTIPDQDFTISAAFAKLKTTISVNDWVSGTSFPVTIDLTWTAAGPARRESSHDHYHSAHYNVNYRWSGAYRPADATGTASDGTTNFTPETSMWANFGTGRGMWLQVNVGE